MRNKLILLVVILLGLMLVAFVSLKLPNQTKTQTQQKSNNSISYQSQTDEKGAVIVEAAPTKLSSKENSKFIVKFTTHSVELSYNIKNIAILTDDKGNQYKVLSWSGGKGGHHLSGTLTFPKLSQKASAVTLKIPGIDNIDRVFTWNLK